MAIRIETRAYETTHGKAPRGTGQWAFTREASHGQDARMIFTPAMTYREACAWVRRAVRAEGFQDATLTVGA